MKILLTGGSGYIGSHTYVELWNVESDVVIVNNLLNATWELIPSIEKINSSKFIWKNKRNDRENIRRYVYIG